MVSASFPPCGQREDSRGQMATDGGSEEPLQTRTLGSRILYFILINFSTLFCQEAGNGATSTLNLLNKSQNETLALTPI